MTVLSPSPDDQTTPADDIKQEAQQEDPRLPPHLHNIERYFTVTSSEQKTTAKNNILTALKAQKKPATKNYVSNHIKKPAKNQYLQPIPVLRRY